MGFWANAATMALDKVTKSLSMTGQWGSLHPDLIATLTQCDVDGKTTAMTGTKDEGGMSMPAEAAYGISISAPIKEGNVEHQFNWASPFEAMNPEGNHQSVMGALQSGMIPTMLQSAALILPPMAADAAADASAKAQKLTGLMVGRSGITKMNSRQVFNGNAPIKISMTLLFRAYQDPQSEVVNPYMDLLKMAYPEELAKDAVTWKAEHENLPKLEKAIGVLMPSIAPKFVSFRYKGETYAPMVIESVSKPLDAPYSTMGELFLQIPVVLGTLSSWDARDVAKIRSNAMNSLVDDAVAGVQSLFK